MRSLLLLGLSALFAGTVSAADLPSEPSFTNSAGMKIVRIEPGTFLMGSVQGGDFDERPVHKVTIRQPFYLGVTEVTNTQYEQFDPAHRQLRGKLGLSKADDEAVVFVSWNDATRFCQWLSEKEGRPYRLPTEAEWEYACRANTTTDFCTGESLPKEFQKNVRESWFPGGAKVGPEEVVSLTVGRTPANPWGLYDMHGNVEEWCLDWYGPYESKDVADPVGRATGDFRVTRGGSHSTKLAYLRSANRMGTLPEDRSWLIGFRVALGKMPATQPLPAPPPPLNQQHVNQKMPVDLAQGLDPGKPYFRGPRTYVHIPPDSAGPLFSKHNHDPAIVACPNGDLLAIWYTCLTEPGRELGILASRLRYRAEQWEPASPFWDAPDRNDHAPALWFDGDKSIYHFNGLSAAATWGSLATILRVSTDSGATWSAARLICPEHGLRHMPVQSVFRTREGCIILPCDASAGAIGGTAVQISRDHGASWHDPGEGRPAPDFQASRSGAWIAGIHAGVTQLTDGRLLALGRGNNIDGLMPMSISADLGCTWTYSASPFPPLGGGQRLVLLRLAQGPIFLASFAKQLKIKDAAGTERTYSGLFAALSEDEGQTWSVRRLISDDGSPRQVDGGGNTGKFILSAITAEPRGYLAVCQTRDGLIQLISSKQHYTFNLAWLKASPPVPAPITPKDARTLPTSKTLTKVFVLGSPPSKTPPWRFTGSGTTEAQAVSFPSPGVMKLVTGKNQRARWADDSTDSFGRNNKDQGFTVEIRMQVNRSTSASRGIDLEARTAEGRRYFISVTTSGVYWYGTEPELLAEGLDNHTAMHSYRISVRADGVAQIYRDGQILGLRPGAAGNDPLFKGGKTYLQWGEGAAGSEADALIAGVAYDLAGPFQPEAQSHP